LLHHNRPRGYGLAVADVSHLELYEIAGTQWPASITSSAGDNCFCRS